MSTFPEQFSAASKSHVEAQIAFLQHMAARSFEGAEKIIALNLAATRASLEKNTSVVHDIINAKDPRDLIALTTRSQEHFDRLLAYGRELISIASGAHATLQPLTPAAAPRAVPELRLAAANEPAEAAPPLPAKVKPIVKAVAKPLAKPVAAPVTLDDSPLVVSGIAPVDAAPPVKAPEPDDLLSPKPKKKK